MKYDDFHVSVLLTEVIDYLDPEEGDIVYDGTLGGAGHTVEIIKAIAPTGKVIGVDLNSQTLSTATSRLKSFAGNILPVNDNFANIKNILSKLNIKKVNKILLDLGLSSFLIDKSGRGFSYLRNERLDMRFSLDTRPDAYEVINKYSEKRLKEIFLKYGEERFSGRIAANIIRHREGKYIETTGDLVDIVKHSIPWKYSKHRKGNPAKRIFQAIRMEVNRELESISKVMDDGFEVLEKGGRMVIISYHSLEDKLVKRRFKELEGICTCPPGLPVCRCGVEKKAEILTRRAIFPSAGEQKKNPRSKSARLRAIEKV
jgi:16S rRNA (cytosine1402-N4)-methyltransferase